MHCSSYVVKHIALLMVVFVGGMSSANDKFMPSKDQYESETKVVLPLVSFGKFYRKIWISFGQKSKKVLQKVFLAFAKN